MQARQHFLARVKRLKSALSISHVANNGIGDTEHNAVANILRKGLGIMAFTVIEDFVRQRSGEALDSISASLVEFSNLPQKFQAAAIEGALKAILFQANLKKKTNDDWMSFLQSECANVHSTANPHYQISNFSFVSRGSNVAPNEISELFKSLCIKNAWKKMTSVSNAIGGGIPDLEQAYINAMAHRHRSAHDPSFEYGQVTLQGLPDEITAIAASMDILITARCRQISSSPTLRIEEHDIDRGLSYRFLEEKDGRYRETRDIGGRARKIWDSIEVAIAAIQPTLTMRSEFLVCIDQKRRISNWYS